ncbi:MAG: hypothetical protein ABEJ65_05985 [bacterium]
MENVEKEMDGMSEWESVNFLLRLVQEGFEYKTDDKQFNGDEVWMVPPQTAYYPYTDCEDRAIFFGWLVQNVMDRNAVGVKWPGHLSAALEYKGKPRGRYVKAKGSTYLLADPTYIGAGPGKVMPGLKKIQPNLLIQEN